MAAFSDTQSSWRNFVSLRGLASLGISAVFFKLAKYQDGRVLELDRAQVLDTFASVSRLEHMLPLLVVLRGRVTCREPSTCQLNGAQAVMRELVEEEVYFKEQPNGRTAQECFEVRREQEQREAFLEDLSGSIRLESLEHATGLSGVMEVKREFRPVDLLQGTLLQAVLSKALKSMVKHGVRITERYLPVDTMVTVVGELVPDCVGSGRSLPVADGGGTGSRSQLVSRQPVTGSSSDDLSVSEATGKELGSPVASGADSVTAAVAAAAATAGAEMLGKAALSALPYTLRMPGHGPFHVTTLPLPQLRASLERTAGILRAFAWGIGMIGAVLVARKAVWAYQRLQAHRHFRRLMAAAAPGDNDDGDSVRGPGTCVVCLDRESDIVFVPCGHMCVCASCSASLRKCPICRVASQAIRVYRS